MRKMREEDPGHSGKRPPSVRASVGKGVGASSSSRTPPASSASSGPSRPSESSGAAEEQGFSGFAARHIGPSRPEDRHTMLRALGVPDLETLVHQAVPEDLRLKRPLSLAAPWEESQVLERLRHWARQNRSLKSLIGLGYYGCHTPAVLRRNFLENPAWYTAYTPYQAEISQGRLEALLIYQTMVADLTGCAVANASLLDEASAAAEAMLLARRASKSKSNRFYVAHRVYEHVKDVLKSRAEFLDIELVWLEEAQQDTLPEAPGFGVLLSYPDSSGDIRDPSALIASAHRRQMLVAVSTDLLACCLLRPPGELGADIVFGSAQRMGVPLFYGGPHAGFFAVTPALQRQMPGRVIGVSVDRRSQPAYRMALQTREQHIRREKATSNICTAQALLAMLAGFYAMWHGPRGLQGLALGVADKAQRFAAFCDRQAGLCVLNRHGFDTVLVEVSPEVAGGADQLYQAALESGYNLRREGPDRLGLSFDETCTEQDLETLARVFAPGNLTGGGAPLASPPLFPACFGSPFSGDPGAHSGAHSGANPLEAAFAHLPRLPEPLRRRDTPLSNPIFSQISSETAMMRYLRRLSDKDIGLDRSMIALGSCTMKLNAATEMETLNCPGMTDMHPFVPPDQASGWHALLDELARELAEITGFDAMCLQPNAGSQGEYAGLRAIRAWHRARGDDGRDLCLIPVSSHGTNAASAAAAGLRVQSLPCTSRGDVDQLALEACLDENRDSVAALMITYPSTHGVFETHIRSICELVHAAGGQVYMDGANLNAQLGLMRPGDLGADVAHLNLHKTFCIPHGGGGPGAGPIGIKAHLAPYVPGHRCLAPGRGGPQGAIASAPYGSAGILPISWAYIRMMGRTGLTEATKTAILSANYLAKRLSAHYTILYVGQHDRVAHEFILDLREFKKTIGLEAEDVAKRLIDYGFHAPTMSFPVPGTLMVEPTESEPLEELDRFIDALLDIRAEIRQIETGGVTLEASVLRNAPHCLEEFMDETWPHPYSRARAFALAHSRKWAHASAYCAPVARVDGVYGDRNLQCRYPVPDRTPATVPDTIPGRVVGSAA